MFRHRWERKIPEKPAMASCMDGLPLRSPHGPCWVGSWARHMRALTPPSNKSKLSLMCLAVNLLCFYYINLLLNRAEDELTSCNTHEEDQYQFHLSSKTTGSQHRAIYGQQSRRSLGVCSHFTGGEALPYKVIFNYLKGQLRY